MEAVELVHNNLQHAGAKTIGRIFTQSKTIQTLCIYDTSLEHEGAKLLCQEIINSSVRRFAIPRKYYEWMRENHPHLIPQGRVVVLKPPKRFLSIVLLRLAIELYVAIMSENILFHSLLRGTFVLLLSSLLYLADSSKVPKIQTCEYQFIGSLSGVPATSNPRGSTC